MTKDHIPFDIELSLLDLNFQLKENDHMNGGECDMKQEIVANKKK